MLSIVVQCACVMDNRQHISVTFVYWSSPFPFTDMIMPRTQTVRYGPRSFRVVAPQIWNTLPSHLKNISISREQFKSGLKTWLFVQAYSLEAPLRSGALQMLDLI